MGCEFCLYSWELISIYAATSFDNEHMLAGVGYGNILMEMIGIGGYFGLNNALATLAS